MNILITGGSGYLGKHLTKVLKNDSTNSVISLSSKDVDLKVSGSLDKFNYIKFDKIYHLASRPLRLIIQVLLVWSTV